MLMTKLFLFALTCASMQSGDVKSNVDKLANPLVDGGVVASLVIGVVDGEKTHVFGYGKVNASSNVKPDGSTIYEIGSITKVFTASLLADMLSRKQVNLSDPVVKYLPKTTKFPQFEGTPITLMDLATQTSGLPRMPLNFAPKDPKNPYVDYTPQKMLRFLNTIKLTRKPGEKYDYSNLGVGLLGYALSQKAGMSYEKLVRSRICEPLGMKDTMMTLTPTMRLRLAPGHDAGGAAASNWGFDALAGAGALRSNVNDMLRFLKANLGISKTLLSDAFATAQEQRKPIDGGGHIGLNWHITSDGKATWHNGGTAGYRSLIAFNRASKKGVVVLCNTQSDTVDQLGFALLKMMMGESPEPIKVKSAAKIDSALLGKYVGDYELAPGFKLTVTNEDGKLMVQATGQQKLQVFPSADTEFFYRTVDAQITFIMGSNGKTEKLILHQNGRNMTGNKVE